MGVEGFDIAVGQAIGMAIGVAWIPSIVSLHEGILNRSKTITTELLGVSVPVAKLIKNNNFYFWLAEFAVWQAARLAVEGEVRRPSALTSGWPGHWAGLGFPESFAYTRDP